MSASDRTRRELFERGGGRCAMCQRSLVIDPGPEGTEYHIAEAAHIVAESAKGPRGGVDRPVDVNGIDNLVLLCPSDHRTIDKGDGDKLWPPSKLLRLKRDHEAWTAVLAARPAGDGGVVPAPVGSGDVVEVDGRSYQVCDAFEVGRGWWQGHVYGPDGHGWLRGSRGDGRLRAALADEVALHVELPRLPRLLEVEMTAETVTLVTAIPSPTTVREGLARTKPIGRDELVLLAGALPQLCEVLGELHDRGLAHRALTPETILMPDAGSLALRDLGLATVPPQVGERDDPYHAPEQASGSALPGPPADVHRLARVLYELVTGRPAGRRGRQVAPSVLNPAVPAAWDAMFRRALDAEPGRRPGVRAFGAGLRESRQGGRSARRPR